ncbi:hypothetical protein [Zavarzinia sp.]|jgi:hypothetical protein|uniref:hypothetical protein n=1 Tax=Zavarzinia sp. TaxID=2027920 RepID=UPI00356B1328
MALTAIQKENIRRSLDGTGVNLDQASALLTLILDSLPADIETARAATPVLGVTVTAQPASPEDGDKYILGAAAPYTGTSWATFLQGQIAEYTTALGWVARTPGVGELFSYTDGASPPATHLYVVKATGGFAYETLTDL